MCISLNRQFATLGIIDTIIMVEIKSIKRIPSMSTLSNTKIEQTKEGEEKQFTDISVGLSTKENHQNLSDPSDDVW